MKKRYRSFLAAVLAGTFAVGCLTGCGKMDEAAGGKMTAVTLNEVAHSIFYAPQYAAIEIGYFEEEGIDMDGADLDEILEADEVFEVGDGRYLIVEG